MAKKKALSLLRELKTHGIPQENEQAHSTMFFGRERLLNWIHEVDKERVIGGRHWGVYGIRRSGKTTLIEKFIAEALVKHEKEGVKSFHLTLTGDNTRTMQENITRAFFALNEKLKQFNEKYAIEDVKIDLKDGSDDWDSFFSKLKKIITETKKYNVRFYLFFDEVLWFGRRSAFLSSLGYFINNDIMSLDNVSTFIASSSNGWIREKVFQDKNGLHKRFIPLKVPPFSFEEICSLFKLRGWIEDKTEILKYYLLFGGFVKYYNEVKLDYKTTLENNLLKLQDFHLYLKEESGSLLQGIFHDKEYYQRIINEIVKNNLEKISGLNELGLSTLYRQLKELEMANILQSYNVSTKKYYYCVIPIFHFMQQFDLDKSIENVDLSNWRGKMFELFVFQNLSEVKKKLGIKNSLDILDLKLYNRDFGEEESPNKCICQCDIIVEERGKNNKRLKNTKVYLLELKFKSAKNISENDKNELRERAAILDIYYKELLNVKDCQIVPKLLLPETAREDWLSFF